MAERSHVQTMTDSSSLGSSFSSIPILDLAKADSKTERVQLLQQLHDALFNVGFLYIINHDVPQSVIDNLTDRLPSLFDLPIEVRRSLSKLNSPHFLGYSGFAEETTLGKQDLREQFDYCTELPVIWQDPSKANGATSHNSSYGRDFSKLYWRLRGPNQWPPSELVPGFQEAFTAYHDAVADLSYRFLHLVEEAFGIPIGTFDHFFRGNKDEGYENLPPQHRLKLLKYPPNKDGTEGQGVGAHKDSSGW